MVRKPAKMYREVKSQAYTRREYMGGVPGLRINQFEMGNTGGDFPLNVHLVVAERCQIRHTALEAARIAANRHLQKRCGSMNYHLRVRVYPHIVLRENKQATGAGADRVSEGMRRAFGKAVGTAARVKPGQQVMTVRTSPPYLNAVKEALRRAGMKLPTPFRVVVEEAS